MIQFSAVPQDSTPRRGIATARPVPTIIPIAPRLWTGMAMYRVTAR